MDTDPHLHLDAHELRHNPHWFAAHSVRKTYFHSLRLHALPSGITACIRFPCSCELDNRQYRTNDRETVKEAAVCLQRHDYPGLGLEVMAIQHALP
jgi:hypothetical protein